MSRHDGVEPGRAGQSPTLQRPEEATHTPALEGRPPCRPRIGSPAVRRTGLDAALGVVALALACGCAGPRVAAVDPEVRRAADGAAAALAGGATERAVAGYEAALSRAALIDSPAEVARNAHNLAAVLAAAGRLADPGGRHPCPAHAALQPVLRADPSPASSG